MRKNNGFTLIEILVGLTILAVLAVGAYTVWQRPVKREPTITPTVMPSVAVTEAPTSTLTPTQIAEATAAPTPGPIAGWQAFTGPGFIIKYPSDARIESTSDVFKVYLGAKGTLAGADPTLTIESHTATGTPSHEKFLAQRLSMDLDDLRNDSKRDTVSLGGDPRVLRVVLDSGSYQGPGPFTYYIALHNGKRYLLWSNQYVASKEAGGSLALNPGGSSEKINQILSTFQFTD